MFPGNSVALRGFVSLFSNPSQLSSSSRMTTAVLLLALSAGLSSARSQSADRTLPGGVPQSLPLSFEENRGQADPNFRYLLRYNGSQAAFSRGSVDFRIAGVKQQDGTVRMRLLDSDVSPEGRELLEGRSNYLIGADASKWIRSVPHVRRVEYNEIYPGVSLAFYGNGNALEHDFTLDPGADPARIRFRFEGAEGATLSEDGDLVVHAAGQILKLRKPTAYQTVATVHKQVDAQFVFEQDGAIGFRVGNYNRSLPLVIDPVFVFSSYLSGTAADTSAAVTTDAAGNIYLTGKPPLLTSRQTNLCSHIWAAAPPRVARTPSSPS